MYRTEKSDPTKTKPMPLIVNLAQYDVQGKVFDIKSKLKEKAISVSESLTKQHLVKSSKRIRPLL